MTIYRTYIDKEYSTMRPDTGRSLLSSSDQAALDTLGLAPIVQAFLTIENELKSDTSKRVYKQDTKQFASWLSVRGIAPRALTRADMHSYQNYLLTHRWYTSLGEERRYSNITMNRMFTSRVAWWVSLLIVA